jgi:hypothetical protein
LILAQLSEVLSKQAEQDNINSDLRAAIQSRSLTQEHSRQQPQDAGLSSDPHNHSQITATSETQFEDKAHKPEIVSALADAIRISTLKAPTLEHNDRLNIRLFKSKYEEYKLLGGPFSAGSLLRDKIVSTLINRFGVTENLIRTASQLDVFHLLYRQFNATNPFAWEQEFADVKLKKNFKLRLWSVT